MPSKDWPVRPACQSNSRAASASAWVQPRRPDVRSALRTGGRHAGIEPASRRRACDGGKRGHARSPDARAEGAPERCAAQPATSFRFPIPDKACMLSPANDSRPNDSEGNRGCPHEAGMAGRALRRETGIGRHAVATCTGNRRSRPEFCRQPVMDWNSRSGTGRSLDRACIPDPADTVSIVSVKRRQKTC